MNNDQSNVLDIYDDNNQNVREFRRNLEREVQSAIEQIQDGSFEKEMANTLIKMQNKIHILLKLKKKRLLELKTNLYWTPMGWSRGL